MSVVGKREDEWMMKTLEKNAKKKRPFSPFSSSLKNNNKLKEKGGGEKRTKGRRKKVSQIEKDKKKQEQRERERDSVRACVYRKENE